MTLRLLVSLLASALFVALGPASPVEASTPIEKCGKVTAFDFGGTPLTNAGTLFVDGEKFVVGHPQGFRRSDVPPLNVPYANIRLSQTVCVRGQVDPLPGGWHLLSGEVLITAQGLPGTSTAPEPHNLNAAGFILVALLFGGLLTQRRARPRA